MDYSKQKHETTLDRSLIIGRDGRLYILEYELGVWLVMEVTGLRKVED